ncbi:hypothetical protein [Calycomorphotria hydatis]|uniref:Uncharacterized protein n=1 Tax=Calycomorphotria hydatis TaxID=2528027 RepID=A0A517TCZ2_9PLAN|nr:hypothetical protein [Calycomorphotria hydatis]QDT66228.1 hypothetical protein V22_34930 [Calycomorphotria hydatis]
MTLVPRTSIGRYVSIGGNTIVFISRCKMERCYDASSIDHNKSWAFCNNGSPDSFWEYGSLANVFHEIGSKDQVIGAATASPLQFALMVSEAHDLGRVISVGSVGRMAMGDRYANSHKYCEQIVADELLTFYSYRVYPIREEIKEPPGLYKNVYSLSIYEVVLHELEPAELK